MIWLIAIYLLGVIVSLIALYDLPPGATLSDRIVTVIECLIAAVIWPVVALVFLAAIAVAFFDRKA